MKMLRYIAEHWNDEEFVVEFYSRIAAAGVWGVILFAAGLIVAAVLR